MKDNKFIEEKNLDELLNNLFIEENSMKADENSARFILEQEYDVRIDAGKEKNLLKRLNGKAGGSGGYTNFLIFFCIVIILGTGIFLFNKHINPSGNKSKEHFYKSDKKEQSVNSENIPVILPIHTSLLSTINDSTYLQLRPPFISSESYTKPSSDFSGKNIPVYFPPSELKEYNSSTELLESTEKDFLLYSKVKTKMFEKLLKAEKGSYTMVEEGKIQYRGNTMAVDPFILRNQAITNLEYKVFLADLIKNGNTGDYKIAAVKNKVWINYYDNILAKTYFSDEKYNDFPVVNISPEGALLFCTWMEKEINKFSKSVDPKSKPLKIRLPFDSDWIFATRRGYAQIPDCGGYNTIYDIKEGIIDISYIKRIELIKRRSKSKITELDQLFSTNRYGMEEDKTLQLFEKGFAYKGKPVTDSVYPNRMDVFSKVAHVSEIIQEQGTGKAIVIGSCWKSKQEYSKMLTEFNKESASPFIGFRVVIINDNKASYKDPFW